MMMTFTRSERLHYKGLRAELIDAHRYVRGTTNTPRDTAEILIDRVGLEDAVWIVAMMIGCRGSWDARISRTNRGWAEDIEPFCDEIAAGCMLFYCDEVHPCHMDAIADYLRTR